MPVIHFHQTTSATPEEFLAALTDFGPGRATVFANGDDDYLQVHDLGPEEADVTEGSHGVWERLHYDWSDPDRVVMKTTDSNVWGGESGHIYTFERLPDGRTDIDVVIVREPKNLKGRLIGLVLKRPLIKSFGKTVSAVEARNDRARTAQLN